MKSTIIHKDLENIKKAVDVNFKMDIARNTRKTEYIRARSIYYMLCKELTNYPLYAIGAPLNKDHANVLHGLRNFKSDIFNNDYYNKEFNYLIENLKLTLNDEKFLFDFNLLNANKLIDELKKNNQRLKNELDSNVFLQDKQEKQLIKLFRSLDFKGKEDAVFKINIAKKVSENMQHKELRKII